MSNRTRTLFMLEAERELTMTAESLFALSRLNNRSIGRSPQATQSRSLLVRGVTCPSSRSHSATLRVMFAELHSEKVSGKLQSRVMSLLKTEHVSIQESAQARQLSPRLLHIHLAGKSMAGCAILSGGGNCKTFSRLKSPSASAFFISG